MKNHFELVLSEQMILRLLYLFYSRNQLLQTTPLYICKAIDRYEKGLLELYFNYFQNYHNSRNELIKMHFSEDLHDSGFNIFHNCSQKCHLCKQIQGYIITIMLKTKGCFYLPSNKKDGIIFGLFMCFG